MRPINNVVDITNYVMLETGQPLHAFDYDLVRGGSITVRRAKPGEQLVTLDGVDREFDGEMLLVCDGEGPVGIAGVMGGGNSEVSESTHTILLEVANFQAGSIRRTSTHLKLRSEASLRFEKGLGPEMAEFAARRALHLFATVCGGRPAAGMVDVYPGQTPQRTVVVTAARIEQVLGIPVPVEEVRRILTDLGFVCHFVPPGKFSVQPPYWRPDIEIPDDVIEDIGRIYGYDKLPATMLRGQLPAIEPNPVIDLRERLRDLTVAHGFQEVITYTLTSLPKIEATVSPDDVVRRNPLSVVNPVAAQHTYLRTSLRPSLLETFAANRRVAETALRLFEVGAEYLPREGDLPHERPVVCALLGGPRENRWGRAGEGRLDFFDAKGVVEGVSEACRIPVKFAPAAVFGMLEGHTAAVMAGGTRVGVVGQVHPDTAAAFDIDEPVFLAEFWVEELAQHVPERPAYQAPSRFPEVRKDIALLVDASNAGRPGDGDRPFAPQRERAGERGRVRRLPWHGPARGQEVARRAATVPGRRPDAHRRRRGEGVAGVADATAKGNRRDAEVVGFRVAHGATSHGMARGAYAQVLRAVAGGTEGRGTGCGVTPTSSGMPKVSRVVSAVSTASPIKAASMPCSTRSV